MILSLASGGFRDSFHGFPFAQRSTVRDDYLKAARAKIEDPNVLVNLVSRRVKQLKNGFKPLVESLERLDPEDIALREIMEDKIRYELFDPEEEQT